ncbi:MAG: hypothetical protein JNJ61_30865 [Anaerolineae bacterium]|nr:hypothetical protein [Anaerolineae bacterium]
MMTWRLWRAFQYPPVAHPLFKRVISASYADTVDWPPLLQNLLIQGQVWFWSLMFVIDMRLLFLMLFSGTLYGAIWAISVSRTICGERESGTYDLLCLAPHGMIGTTWAIWAGCLHRNDLFRHVNSHESWTVRVVLFLPLIISAHLILRHLSGATGAMTVIWIIVLLVIFYLDHVQSILIGGLFGALAAHDIQQRLDPRLWALAGFIGIQLATYTALVLSGRLMAGMGVVGLVADVALPLVSVVIFYGLREYIVCRLWHLLLERLNAAPTETDSLLRQAA